MSEQVVVEETSEMEVTQAIRAVEQEVNEIQLPRYGKPYRAKIKRIKVGPCLKLIQEMGVKPERVLERCKQIEDVQERYRCYKRWFRACYLVTLDIPELGIEGTDLIRWSTHRNSRMAELARCYKVLTRNKEVWVILTETGRVRIVCPPEEEEGH